METPFVKTELTLDIVYDGDIFLRHYLVEYIIDVALISSLMLLR
jgi:hypothetical protein